MLRKHHKPVECVDGFKVSIQAGEGHYCSPRTNEALRWDSVELGYPSSSDYLITEFAEDADNLTESVYGWVPVGVVYLLLTKHGGVVSGEVPKGVPVYSLSHPKKK